MPEYLSPGVYIEEIDVGTKPIEGVSTSNLGIVGQTERGPRNVRLITSWLEFQRLYGDPLDVTVSFMPLAVKGFFDNGGRRCFVARVTGENAGVAGAAFGGLQVNALGPGTSGNNIVVRIRQASLAAAQFRVDVLYYRDGIPNPFVDPLAPGARSQAGFREPTAVESFDNLSPDPNLPNYAPRELAGSSLVWAEWDEAGDPAHNRPADTQYIPLAGGTSPAVDMDAYTGGTETEIRDGQDYVYSTGLTGLAAVDEVNILAAPDEHMTGLDDLRTAVVNQCEDLRERFAVFSVPSNRRNATEIIGNNEIDPPTTYAALYWPWIWVLHPRTAARVLVPPVGHVAGIYARTDIDRGVHKAPANEVIRGAVDLQFPVPRGQQDLLNPRGLNVLRDFRPDRRGIRVWGARTLSIDPMWKYVNVRRLFLYLEESIEEGTQWVVFEPNSEPLWDRVKRSIESFLLTVWRNGALMGTRPDQAFYVKCDRTTMTQDDIDNGRLICYIGVAPVKPAEFVIFRIHQWALGAKTAV
jgi:phage tail sheath protein FI